MQWLAESPEFGKLRDHTKLPDQYLHKESSLSTDSHLPDDS